MVRTVIAWFCGWSAANAPDNNDLHTVNVLKPFGAYVKMRFDKSLICRSPASLPAGGVFSFWGRNFPAPAALRVLMAVHAAYPLRGFTAFQPRIKHRFRQANGIKPDFLQFGEFADFG